MFRLRAVPEDDTIFLDECIIFRCIQSRSVLAHRAVFSYLYFVFALHLLYYFLRVMISWIGSLQTVWNSIRFEPFKVNYFGLEIILFTKVYLSRIINWLIVYTSNVLNVSGLI